MAEVSGGKAGEISGVGGWLILPAIVCVIAPVVLAYGGIENFVSAARVSYRYQSTLYLDGMIALILAAAWLGCGYLMFRQHKLFPKIFIALLAAGVGRVLVATFLFASLGANIAPLGASFAQAFVPAAIWIPYMLLSKRVKATFTRE